MSVFREDPYPAFNFLVEIDALGDDAGGVTAGFSEVSYQKLLFGVAAIHQAVR